MRAFFFFASASAALALGCSGDSATVGPGDASTADASTADASTMDASHADATAGDASQGDASATDSAAGDSSSGEAGIACGNATCTGTDVCCATIADGGMGASLTCAPSCPDGGVTIACSGPSQCSTQAPLCCATLSVGAGTPPACPFQSGSAECKATCPTQIPQSCPGSGEVRLCRTKADCASDPQNQNCCTFSQGGQSATFCASNLLMFGATSCAP